MSRPAGRLTLAVLSLVSILAGLLAPIPALAADPEPSTAPFLFGVGTADANPQDQVCLGGYGSFCNRPSTGIKDPLTTAAFAVTGAGGETVIIAKTTAVGLFASYKPEQGPNGIYAIRQRIAKRTGVRADHVIVTSDHSHAAPDTIGIWGGVERRYMDRLADSVVQAASDAFASRQPAELFVAAVDGPQLDSSYDLPPTDNAAMDEEFRALFAETPAGEPIATMVNYAPHATVCGKCGDMASGDWTAWAAQEIEADGLGVGIGFVGALGATDWNKSDEDDQKEPEARQRINNMLAEAVATRRPVEGDAVRADVVFIREQLTAPVLAANYLPKGALQCPSVPNPACKRGETRIDRDVRPPWLTGTVLGTYVGALRIGDVFFSTLPGEPFPQLQDALRETIGGASEHFMLGAANDFLGYMVADDDQYRQTLQEGAAFLAGCPEEEVTHRLPDQPTGKDGACPDHWTLMVSPTIGRHAVCTIQDAAERIGFTVGERSERCAALTAADGQAAPSEHPGGEPEEEPEAKVSKAGVAEVDATWHVGASGGQFSEDEPAVSEETFDPHGHSTKKRPSYGVGSRSTVRALVVEDAEGEKVAIVSHDLYLPQDLLTRRIATLVSRSTGIPADHVMVTASHNHNSAFYSTPGWGTWLFQDVYDLRFYEYMAEQAAKAVEKANEGLVPVRMGGSTSSFNEITSHSYGPQIADDGTPAGQPYDHTTGELTVVAFDDMSEPDAPKPLATWVVFGVHPEWTWGYDLLNSDISGATTRIVDREIGGITVWSGREIGTSGPHKDTRVHEPEERREYQDNGFAQMDRAARLLATAIEDTRTDVGAGTPERADRFAPFRTSFDVDAVSQRFAPPSTRPYPGVSNCNTASMFHGDPRVPVLGLPDCERVPTGPVGPGFGQIGGQLYDQLKRAGVPIPESYSATALTAVEETAAVHLMAIKLGDVGITVCPCEQFTDTALNIQSRIDRTQDNLWLGFNYARHKTPSGRDWCVRNENGTWSCANPKNPSEDLKPVDDLAYRRMIAQIENDAAGWEIDDGEDVENDVRTLGGEAEPHDPAQIKGNFTHEEFPSAGFGLPIAVGMGNDYWGYMPEYREYRSHDHYRKALSGLGPHGADFLATRLSRMAVSMNGGPGAKLRPIDLAFQAESVRAEVVANGLGELADAYERVYTAQLPKDGGTPKVISGPDKIELFSAAHLTWVGGSTYAEVPDVRVERLVDGEWRRYGDITGEVQLTTDIPDAAELPEWRAGEYEWTWTAAFEAFGADVTLPNAVGERERSTPFGRYRFVVEGERRMGKPAPSDCSDPTQSHTCKIDSLEPYTLRHEFEVAPWDGIVVRDMRAEETGVSFDVSSGEGVFCGGKIGQSELEPGGEIDVPDSYKSPFRYIECAWKVFKFGRPESEWQSYCSFCSFRPWADTSDIASAVVTVRLADGTTEQVPATARDGRWYADVELFEGDSAYVERGGVEDEYGDINGAGSGEVSGTQPRPTPTETTTPDPDPTETGDPDPDPTETGDPDPDPTGSPDPDPTPSNSPSSGGGNGEGGGGNGGGGNGGGDPSPSSSPSQTPAGPRPSSIRFTDRSATSVQYSDEATFEALLTGPEGQPLGGRAVAFELRGPDGVRTLDTTTGADGLARSTIPILDEPGTYSLAVRFGGDEDYLGSADISSFVVDKEESRLELKRVRRFLVARLSDRDTRSFGISGQKISFSLGGRVFAADHTNRRGVARVRLPQDGRKRSGAPKARYRGNSFYLGSSDRLR